jgi:hypothetical protein
MSNMKLASVLVAALLLTVVSAIHTGPAVGSGMQGSSINWQPVVTGTTIFVVPDQLTVFENDTFIVNVRLNDVVNLAGWQFDLYWDSAMLRCLNATVNTPVEWGGLAFDFFNKTIADANEIDPNSVYAAWQFGSGIDNNYDVAHGRYSKAECYGPYGSGYHNTFNGSISLVTLTFKATHSGTTALTLGDTLLGDSSALAMQHTKLSGSKVLLVSGVTETPQTPDKPVKDNNQIGQETSSTPPAISTPLVSSTPPTNWTLVDSTVDSTLDNITVTYLPATFPIEAFPVNVTLTPPIEAFPSGNVTLP